MSGGYFYNLSAIEDYREKLRYLIESNSDEDLNVFGEVIGREYSDETLDIFRNTLNTLSRIENTLGLIDELVSSDIIIAYANGEKLQYKLSHDNEWYDVYEGPGADSPNFNVENIEWRIKPETKIVRFKLGLFKRGKDN